MKTISVSFLDVKYLFYGATVVAKYIFAHHFTNWNWNKNGNNESKVIGRISNKCHVRQVFDILVNNIEQTI